jgi:hypothetical protein
MPGWMPSVRRTRRLGPAGVTAFGNFCSSFAILGGRQWRLVREPVSKNWQVLASLGAMTELNKQTQIGDEGMTGRPLL